ncbi:MAG TPA: methyltransferase domain-containing protein [Microbacteriaceae bacterium]|jgi:SAM-dependent methyltransferase|nr:methyltransferase domain-containing protein [Microbacteriaceae bacterium]
MDDVTRSIQTVTNDFPFPGYIEAAPRSHRETARTVLRYVPRGGRILDFAAGPLDKTAVLQELGYRCSAYDDLSDPWHTAGDNRQQILDYAARIGIDYTIAPEALPEGPFDMVMAHDILEHLHESPRALLAELLGRVTDGGWLFITVPNAVNLRKRIAVLRGATNLPNFASYFWFEGQWRGHIREYVRDDLANLAELMGLDVAELRGTHHLAHHLSTPVRLPYVAVTRWFDGLRDTWLLVARKRPGWDPAPAPTPEVAEELRRIYSPYWGL